MEKLTEDAKLRKIKDHGSIGSIKSAYVFRDFLLSSNQICDMFLHIEKCGFQSEI